MKNFCLSVTLIVLAEIVFAMPGPIAFADSGKVFENSSVTIAITANDLNTTGGNLTVSFQNLPLNGNATIINSNQIRYNPLQSFTGVDSLQYKICDSMNQCSLAWVYVNVLPNSPPNANSDNFVFGDTVSNTTLNVLSNDHNAQFDTLYLANVLNLPVDAVLGSVAIDSTGQKLVFTHTQSSCGVLDFNYVVCNSSFCDTVSAEVKIICPADVFMPEGFSPNGDGKNDLLVFTRLEYFAPASLKIFNRYGTTIYQSDDYKNDWDGREMDSHQSVPDGTYFYMLQLADGRKYTNYLVVNR